jgi:long-subunit acyl-CoA synthetase (AMP-forming)
MTQIKDYNSLSPNITISYMPLNHMADRMNTTTCIINGGRVGIYSDIKNIFEDILELEPSYFTGPPSFYNKIYKEFQNADNEKLQNVSKIFGKRIKVLSVGGKILK